MEKISRDQLLSGKLLLASSSRMLPEIKDCKTLVKDGTKIKAQKELLLYNLLDL